MKRLPYGLSDFPRLISEDYYYVDKTRYIELLENQPNFLFLLRPRRFGKSLFMAMLETYYSIDYRERFDELFSGLYIGQHPTPSRNKYLALRFNFSEVSSNPDEVERSFKAYCNAVIIRFVKKYEHLLGKEIWEELDREEESPGLQLGKIARYISDKGCPHIYLLIDEYDNFTNTLLATYGTERYRRTTHGEGFIREFFNTIKAATTGPGAAIDRLFITGVSPVTMDDVTSGFNIGTNISLLPQFNGIIGFSTEEVRRMVGYYQSEGALPADVTVDGLLEEMKPWYDNYCFSEDASYEHMFNSDMTLYFLNSYLQQQRPPRQMVDNNIRTDYGKLRHLVQVDRRLGKNTSVIQQLVSEGRVTASIATSFPAERMVETDNFKSLLFYFGMLSIQGTDFGDTILGIPNLTVREQLYTYLVEAYRNASLFALDLSVLSDLVKGMALHGEWEPVFRYFAAELERQSAVREFIEGEAHVKGFLLAYLGLTRGYIVLPEHESSKGYADFYMMPDLQRQPDIAYSYLVEVKYARRDATPADLAALKEQAASLLHRYAADEKVQKGKGHTTLRLLTLLFRGWELETEEVM